MILPRPREELDGMEIRRNTVALRHRNAFWAKDKVFVSMCPSGAGQSCYVFRGVAQGSWRGMRR